MTLTAAQLPARGRATPELLARLAARATTAAPRPVITEEMPATGEPLGGIPHGTEDDVRHAAALARAAQPAWAATPLARRCEIALRFHDLLLDRREELLDLVQAETGKSRRHAFEEVLDTAGLARYYARNAARHLRPHRRRGAFPAATLVEERRVPVGVVGVIAPWNYPIVLTAGDTVPALLAGCSVLLKPDHQTSFAALYVAELLAGAGLPDGVLQVVTGPGPELGSSIISAVDYLMYTGSTRTGRVVAQEAAARLIGSSLELGGKNPMVVLADADLDRTVEGAIRACFANGGQSCVSMERIYVEQPCYDEFVRRLGERVRAVELGSALDHRAEMGSLQSARQLETVRAHVDDAVAKGATLVAGGRHRPDLGPYFFEPTVLTGVTREMTCCENETFGPVVSVYPVRDVEEAVARANDTEFGLNASVWGRDLRRAREVARRIRAGTVNVNEGYGAAWASTDAPMGGMKASGLGRRHGAEGIVKYTEAQTVAAQRWIGFDPVLGLSYERYAAIITVMLRLLRRIPR